MPVCRGSTTRPGIEGFKSLAPRGRNGNGRLGFVVKTNQHCLRARHGLPVAGHLVVNVHAFVAQPSDVALNGEFISETDRPQIIDGMMRNEHTHFGPIPCSISHGLTPPMDSRLLHVDDVFGIVNDAVRIDVTESNFRTVRRNLLHGAKVL